MIFSGLIIFLKDVSKSSKPTKRIAIPNIIPVRYSIRAWPKGWLSSAGLPDILKPIKVITDEIPSDKLFTPSAITEILLNNIPVIIFAALNKAFTIIPTTLAVIP